MTATRKSSLPKIFDLSLVVALVLTGCFYLLVTQESFKDSIVARYTTEHVVEYVIVGFFIWGLTDVAFRSLGFPSETSALRQPWLPARGGREPISHAAGLLGQVQKKPRWLRESRIGQRLAGVLGYLKEQGSTDGLADHLRYLAELDEEKTHGHYALVRFICWVTPMLGFLGTVVHFGTALGGQEAGDIGEQLPKVVSEMGTAFNTTTIALIAATTMMFCLFLCERTERGILHTIDRRMERDLLHRFQTTDASMAPLLPIIEAANQAHLRAMDATLERQLQIWSSAFDTLAQQSGKRQEAQSAIWEQALVTLQERFETNESARENGLAAVLESMQSERELQRSEVHVSVEQVSSLHTEFARLVEDLTRVFQSKGEVVKLQAILSDNLRLLRETQQIDQALHGLTAAIHLLTARNQTSSIEDHRAA